VAPLLVAHKNWRKLIVVVICCFAIWSFYNFTISATTFRTAPPLSQHNNVAAFSHFTRRFFFISLTLLS